MDPLAIIDKYYAPYPDLRHVLLTHSRQVAERALRIVDAHPELHMNRDFVFEAAMLHDIGIIFCDAPRIFCMGPHHYIEHGYLGAELLRREGLPMHADVAERHTGTGLTLDEIRSSSWQLPLRDFSPRTLEEIVICYADKFYSKSHIGEELPYAKVRQSIWRYGSDSVGRFDKWQQLFEPDVKGA